MTERSVANAPLVSQPEMVNKPVRAFYNAYLEIFIFDETVRALFSFENFGPRTFKDLSSAHGIDKITISKIVITDEFQTLLLYAFFNQNHEETKISENDYVSQFVPYITDHAMHSRNSKFTLKSRPNRFLAPLLNAFSSNAFAEAIHLEHTGPESQLFLDEQIAINSFLSQLVLVGNWPQTTETSVFELIFKENGVVVNIAQSAILIGLPFLRTLVNKYRYPHVKCWLSCKISFTQEELNREFTINPALAFYRRTFAILSSVSFVEPLKLCLVLTFSKIRPPPEYISACLPYA